MCPESVIFKEKFLVCVKQLYLYSTSHIQVSFKVLYKHLKIELNKCGHVYKSRDNPDIKVKSQI